MCEHEVSRERVAYLTGEVARLTRENATLEARLLVPWRVCPECEGGRFRVQRCRGCPKDPCVAGTICPPCPRCAGAGTVPPAPPDAARFPPLMTPGDERRVREACEILRQGAGTVSPSGGTPDPQRWRRVKNDPLPETGEVEVCRRLPPGKAACLGVSWLHTLGDAADFRHSREPWTHWRPWAPPEMSDDSH